MKLKGDRLPPDIILQSVRWFLRCGLSYRILAVTREEPGGSVGRTSFVGWVMIRMGQLASRRRPKLVGHCATLSICWFVCVCVLPAAAQAPGPSESRVTDLSVSADAVGVESTTAGEAKYLLEGIEVQGERRTSARSIRSFVPLGAGAAFDVDDPEIEALRYRLLGTGWFDRVELSLKRGHKPGWVVLRIDVTERRTLVFQQLAAGLGWSVASVDDKAGQDRPPGRKAEPYLGLGVADTNFLGTGKTLGGLVLASPDQQALALNYYDPVVSASRWSLSAHALLANGHEYFGGDNGKNHEVRVSVDCSTVSAEDLKRCEIAPQVAVVDYWRAGLGLGTARDVGTFTRLSLDWHGDYVRVPAGGMPDAASEVRGRGDSARRVRPIDFSIEPGSSVVSMITVGLSFDKRDSAVLPSRGALMTFAGDLASGLLASEYEFVRLQAHAQRFHALPWGHVVRTGLYAGAVFGRAPFFYKFFATDLSDLEPSRLLGLNLDHRPAPNLFGLAQCGRAFDDSCGTAVAQVRQEELAARVDVEYSWPFARGRNGFVKGGDVFGLVGLYSLADPDDLRVAIPCYQGLARLPIDLTLDIGVRLDTQAGVFQLGLAKLFWLPVQ